MPYAHISEATVIPNFVLVTKYLHLSDTLQVQIIPFLASVFSIFLLRQHFKSIPNELHDAANATPTYTLSGGNLLTLMPLESRFIRKT